MSDPTLSQALEEAYASAPTNEIIYHTLEIWHSTFSAPIRVVRDYANIDAKLEATAPRNASATVTFIGYAFDIVPPDQSTTALPKCTIEIDNISREILTQLDTAVLSTGKITVIYRAFLQSALLVGPENLPPAEMMLTQITATPMRISATAEFINLMQQRFPALDYELNTFPGLLP